MKNIFGYLSLFVSLLLFSLPNSANAQQSTWDYVYHIINTNCAGASCHQPGGQAVGYFDATASKTDLYNQLIGVTPMNAYDSVNNIKYVDPGYPHRSLILRKIAHGLGSDNNTELEMNVAEGANMPNGLPALSKTDIEIIRQWVYAGADNSTDYPTADTAVISYYYNIGGRPRIQAPAPPPEGEGFQIHLGPIFMPPNSEHEYFLKHDMLFDHNTEVTGLDLTMNDESHHFILRKFKPGTKQNWDEGLTLLNPLIAFDSDKDYVMAWQNDERFDLPEGTAYLWSAGTALDLNYHIINPHNEILPFDMYLNVYTQPEGTAEKEMKSSLINNAALYIPGDGQEHAFSATQSFSNISVWTIATHTHSRGTGYKVWLKGANGNPDELIYDGHINYATGVNQGYFDWEHPPTRFWEPFLEDLFDTTANGQKMYSGFKHEATYVNTGSPLTFGFTSNDEMMIFYVQYVDGVYKLPADTTNDTTGVAEFINETSYSVYPNPIEDQSTINFLLDKQAKVSLQVTDVLGREVYGILTDENLVAGNYNYTLTSDKLDGAGVYFVKLTINDGESIIRKVVKTK